MKVFIHSFGCRVNQYEGEKVREGFEAAGAIFEESWKTADLCVVNTCSVTDHADRDARVMIRKIYERNPITKVVVTGCYATRAPEELQKLFPEVLIVGNDQKESIPSLSGCSMGLERNVIGNFAGHTRAYIKVQDGCNMKCTYCIIPGTRPTMTSRAPEEILREVQGLLERGYREFVLCGIRLGRYWAQLKTQNSKLKIPEGRWVDLIGLISRIADLEGDFRIRLSSVEVTDLTDRFLQTYRDIAKTVPYFHIPLQSGSDRVLHDMKRWYNTSFYAGRVEACRKFLTDDVAIFTDFMIGFPTEAEQDYKDSMAFADKIGFAGMHIFRFSARSDTPAAALEPVYGGQELKERVEQTHAKDREFRQNYASRFVGKEMKVLVEETKLGQDRARAENFLEVFLPAAKVSKGGWETVKIDGVDKGKLFTN